MHEAEQYLRNPDNPHYLYVRYKNKRRRLFINDKQGDIGIIAIGKRKKATFSAIGVVLTKSLTRLLTNRNLWNLRKK